MTLAQPFVKSTQMGAVLRLTLSRPDQRNPLSLGMLGALNMELDAAMADPDVHVVVIAAEGPAFCAGHDLKELTAARNASDGGAAFFAETFAACEKLMLSIAEGPKPVIAEVQGLATAAGCQLVAACDLAVAAEGAQFATPGVNIGLFCTTPSVPLVRAVGAKVARQMLYTGEPISANQALSAGLITEVMPQTELTECVHRLAQAIAGKPPAVIGLGKSALVRHERLPLREAYSVATCTMVDNLKMPDAVSGIAAFVARKGSKSLN